MAFRGPRRFAGALHKAVVALGPSENNACQPDVIREEETAIEEEGEGERCGLSIIRELSGRSGREGDVRGDEDYDHTEQADLEQLYPMCCVRRAPGVLCAAPQARIEQEFRLLYKKV